jgi:hypothetical protein
MVAYDGAASVPGLQAFARRAAPPPQPEPAPEETPLPVASDGAGGPEDDAITPPEEDVARDAPN